jgi:hypothetical protein
MQDAESVPRPLERTGGTLRLSLVLNGVLLASLVYLGAGRFMGSPGGGVSIVVMNNTLGAMKNLKVSYPGGEIPIGPLGRDRQVGSPLPVQGDFEAVITFEDEADNAFKETVKIKPVGELLLILYVLPVLEESTVTSPDGRETRVLRPSTSHVRILPTFKGEDNNI